MTKNIMSKSESIMINKAQSPEGWIKSNSNVSCRSIKIGFVKNCNDELLKDPTLYSSIEQTLKKYKIKKYELHVLDTDFEYSVDVKLDETNYQILKKII